MNEIEHLLADVSHRPWAMPKGKWEFYQEWNDVLFLHWEVPFEFLRKEVPKELTLDSFEGKYYVSLVAFTMQNIRPRNLPSLKFISDFHEINVRTYINNGNKRGVYFLNIEAEKILSVIVARKLSGLPYDKSNIKRTDKTYQSFNSKKGFKLKVTFEMGEMVSDKNALDRWLTERYCLYHEEQQNIFRFDIHHKEWEIKNLIIENLELSYQFGNIKLTKDTLKLCHYSEGVQVVSWAKEKVKI
ncbi:hypothetical protein D3C86_1231730 [compost metagenome]